MRNRIFNGLKKEERERIFLETLHKKTKGLLRVSEEACLLTKISTAEQFRIDAIFDAQEFKNLLDKTEVNGGTILYGEKALEKLDSSVAVWIDNEDDAENSNRLVIYIPPHRKAKYKKTFIVED